MQRSQFRHFYQMAVRWSDMDALGHVNNVELMRYLESGRVSYCAEVLGIEIGRQIEMGWILADLQCTFHDPLFYPSTIEVATRFRSLGNSSAHLDAAIFHNENDQLILSSKGVFVWFDYQKQTSAKIPETVFQAVKEYDKIP